MKMAGSMARQKHTAEQIIRKLRQAEVEHGHLKSTVAGKSAENILLAG